MRHWTSAFMLCLGAASAYAQGVPGTNLVVDTRVAAVSNRADTVQVGYVLWNRPDSREPLFTFTVDAPGGVLSVPSPQPPAHWRTSTSYRGRPVAKWTVLADELSPGARSPELYFAAVGLPGIVSSWIRGYVPPAPLTSADTNPLAGPSDPLVENSIRTTTVGVVPRPADTTSAGLTARLRFLADRSCSTLRWITSQGVCNSLRVRLDRVAASVAADRREAAAGELRAFVQELEAQHGPRPGKHVGDHAYWLLRVNAEYLLGRL